ncbi:hypothetical protein [Marinospirillum sp.]|uniref:hypothetical protein n=1 Tax=Marinospirillum sp. TaxID=2183934 RepID=UPI0038515B15
MAGFTERYLTQGREEGYEEGLVKGEAQALLKLITLKFGEYPDWVEAKLNEADAAQLDHWVANILTANCLDELFSIHSTSYVRNRQPIENTQHNRDHRSPLEKLRGSVLEFKNPTDPVGVDDWEALL